MLYRSCELAGSSSQRSRRHDALLSRQMVGLLLPSSLLSSSTPLFTHPFHHSQYHPHSLHLYTLVVGEVLEIFLVCEVGHDPRCEKIQPLLICARGLLPLICLGKHTYSHSYNIKQKWNHGCFIKENVLLKKCSPKERGEGEKST